MAIDVKSGDLLTTEELGQHLAIYAGPGAGKTHFLVNNVKRIVESNPKISQSSARKILCITYTNAAVDEIAKRLDGYTDSVATCQVKCNSKLEKISEGEFQLRHLRGR